LLGIFLARQDAGNFQIRRQIREQQAPGSLNLGLFWLR
jgi:hypothetical protein